MKLPPAEPLCVLVIEDDADTREALCEALLIAGHRVIAADSASSAAVLLSSRVVPNVVVLDEIMADELGTELIRELKAIPDLGLIPFVIVTASVPPSMDEADILILRKPIDFDLLLDRVLGMNGGSS